MAKRLTLLLVALLVLGFVVAGCGDDDSDSGNGDTAAETVTDTVTDGETVTEDETVTDTDTVTDDETDTSGGATVPSDLSEARKQAFDQCKKSIGATPQLSDDTKDKLQDLCEKAASGDQEDIQEAAGKVCEEVIDDIAPEGSPGREAALQSCKQQQK